ncbi:phospholipase D-like domain-containing protein [Hymenobacter psychrophilus]|uniref:phospholipase D n=1 Tax=Hymenobacter psychrophilus TaxID=651662 RepID=A0A1H3HPD4_9BACT|nr:phospholipase D-like domain-containing protein [Hymenobacter psychrophilus]SDY17240.1 PLD-like domain-containing protein [Hymenobacter psychrophilus]
MAHSTTPPVSELLSQFRQAFDDVNLSAAEATELRDRLADFQRRHGNLESLRRQLFGLAKSHFNTFKDKAVVEWLEAASALLPVSENSVAAPDPKREPAVTTAAAGQARVYFSPHDDCVGAIQTFIRQARRTLDVCVFTVADNRLSDELLAAHRRGVRVRVLTDNDKLSDRGSDIRAIEAAGIPVRIDRTDNHMHHKFALADDSLVLTGSYNWTRSAAEFNQENLLISPDPTLIAPYAAEFTRLWAALPAFNG